MAEIRTIVVRAIVNGGKAVLLDCRGRKIARVGAERIEKPCSKKKAVRYRNGRVWDEWSRRQLRLARTQTVKQARYIDDPWLRRCANWVSCVKLRKRYGKSPKGIGRLHHEIYKETEWGAACRRMQIAGHNKFRKESRDKWQRWASTVSDNWKNKKERM